MYREITFREHLAQDGSITLAGIRAKCFSDSGQPIPSRKAALLARQMLIALPLKKKIQPLWWDHVRQLTGAIFSHWWESVFEEGLSDEACECVYLNEKPPHQPDDEHSYHQQKPHTHKLLESEVK